MAQKQKTSQECWQFLDCEVMTGYKPNECSNYEACLHNAKNSENRAGKLPYSRHLYNEEDFISVPNCLTVWLDDLEAIEVGSMEATELFYCYENGILIIGEVDRQDVSIPSEAKELGFAKAQLRPYQYDSRLNQWFVMTFHLEGIELFDCIDRGWHDAIKLPFTSIYDVRVHRFTGLVVSFDINNESLETYKDAIAAGWYPAESIEPESDFDM